MPERVDRQIGFRADKWSADPGLDAFLRREFSRLYDQLSRDLRPAINLEMFDALRERVEALEAFTANAQERLDEIEKVIEDLKVAKGTAEIPAFPAFIIDQMVEGNTEQPSEFRLAFAPGIEEGQAVRVRVCQADSWDLAYNAQIEGLEGTLIRDRIMGYQDVILQANEFGFFFSVTNAIVEPMVIRIGPAHLHQVIANYHNSFLFTHDDQD